ncbi:MAG: hydrogenase iron-sulfur subunit [Anaerolineae bacterium]
MADLERPNNLADEPLEQDCLSNADEGVLPVSTPPIGLITPDDIVAATAWQPQRGKLLRVLERIALAIEHPLNRLIGNPALNPLYHTDTIAVYLWLIVAVTGLYLSFFVQFSFDGIYAAIAKMESQLVAHVFRAIHRYASDAAIIVSVLHGFRLFFMGRFRGPRWLAWVTGVLMVVVLVVDGFLGYWLIWDERAQLINITVTNWLNRWFGTGAAFVADMRSAQATDTSWIWIGLLLLAHIVLFGLVAFGYWLHVKRLNRPKFLPARHWLIGIVLLLIVLSAAAPLGMLPPGRPNQLPGQVSIDPIYLFFLPAEGSGSAIGLWLGLGALVVIVTAVPWLSFRRKRAVPVHIDKNLCIGCTKCAVDCPYHAISMQPRTDGKIHKFVAIENTDLCVACGVCVGSCDVQAISVGPLSYDALWTIVTKRIAAVRERSTSGQVKLVFTCERHADNGARAYQNPIGPTAPDGSVEVITLPCVASAPPDLIGHSLDRGATEVRVVGCPPGDCARREGNVWTEGRLTRTRMPRLRRAYANAPIGTYWLPPDDFKQALREPLSAERPTLGRMATPLRWRNLIPALLLFALLYVFSISLNGLHYTPFASGQARVQIVLPSPAVLFDMRVGRRAVDYTTVPVRLSLHVDGQTLFEKDFAPGELQAGQTAPLFENIVLTPGEHHVRFRFDGGEAPGVSVFDRLVDLRDGQVLILDYVTGSARLDRRRP